MATNRTNRVQYHCSFCGKNQDQVRRLIAGPGAVYICDECVDLCREIIDEENGTGATAATAKGPAGSSQRVPPPKSIFEHLQEYVVGQEQAKKVLSVAVYNHYKRTGAAAEHDIELEKSNILLVGPTGVGKTYLAKTLAKMLDVPFSIADATALTEAGYVGEDVENILLHLIQAADFDIQKAERGIIYIDEIDKIARKSAGNPSITRDVSGEGVQQALLKIIEGSITFVPPDGGRKHPQADMLRIDTSDVLFICGGTFEGLTGLIAERAGLKRRMSLGTPALEAKPKRVDNLLSLVTQDDLMLYGLIPELVGRLPVMVSLDPLDQRALIDVLTKPRNAIVKQYQRLLSLDGVELVMGDDALRAAADEAMKRGSGARALRSIVERTLMDVMYEIPSRRDIRKVVVDALAVRGQAAPKLYDQAGRLIGLRLDKAA